ncbi:mechanosensitive ion channel family protein [Desulfoscipio sp. XC116]|uniref:mechanosensitive ion channel family protein n=1 Tax=Desulfoscipio sp. XC116 TaxID=3144975 RepID=UPI00325A5BDA
MLKEQWQLIISGIWDRFTPERIQTLLTDLIASAVVLAATYLIIKILSHILDRTLKETNHQPDIVSRPGGTAPPEDESDGQQRPISDNFIRSARAFLKTLLFYGGYFIAGIIILEIFNFKIISADDLKSLGARLLKIIGVFLGAKLTINLGQLAIKQIFANRIKDNFMENRRAQTLEVLLRSVLTYIIFFLAGLMILEIFSVNTSAILASAGILGLAIGFGAQNLVKDIISGFFILFEDQFNVGDFVETAGVVGTVEEIGLRTCKIREWTGQLHVIPNGEITRVTNYNRGQMMAVVTVGIAYEEDIDQALEVLRQECASAASDMDAILDMPQVQGVTDLAESSVNIRTIAPTVAGEQWAVERELRRRFKYALERAGIEIPYPKRVLYQRNAEGHQLTITQD